LVFLEATSQESPSIPSLFDQLITGPVDHAISQESNLREPSYQHPYQIPNQPRQAMKQAYYQQTPVPMNIRLRSDELEILVPFDLDDKGHLYYLWRTLGKGYLLVDTGNHAVTGMSLAYFDQVYLSQCPDRYREVIRKRLLDVDTPKIETCGVGGRCKTQHVGYIELTFRLTQFPQKGHFTIDCDVNDNDMYDLLIGDSNKPKSRLPPSNMQSLLTDHHIFLQYQGGAKPPFRQGGLRPPSDPLS
jgi:hypothetical protein